MGHGQDVLREVLAVIHGRTGLARLAEVLNLRGERELRIASLRVSDGNYADNSTGASVGRLGSRPSPEERPVSRRPTQGST